MSHSDDAPNKSPEPTAVCRFSSAFAVESQVQQR